MPESAGSGALWALLRRRPALGRLWVGAALSSVGDSLTWTSLTWYLLERTGSGAAIGVLLLCYAMPSAVSGPLLGRWLDGGRVRAITVADNLLRALLVGAVPILDRAGALPLPSLYVLVALLGALTPATRVGLGVAVPKLVPEDERAAANAAIAGTEPLATIVGPALAGLLMARGGIGVALAVDAGSYLAMAWALLSSLPAAMAATPTESGPRARVRDLLARPAVAAVTLLSGLFFFAYGPTEAALPVFVRDRYHAGPGAFGAIWSAVGAGAFLGTFATGWLERLGRTGLVLTAVMALWGTIGAASAFAPSIPFLVFGYFLGGVAWGPYLPLKTTLMQRLVPADRLGAVLGAQSALLTPSMPLGAALGGALLTQVSPQTVLVGVGTACVLGSLAGLCVSALRTAR